MFTRSVQIILSRAMGDIEFARLLVSQPRVALADYDLSVEESAAFDGLTINDLVKTPPMHKRRAFSDIELSGQVRGRKQYL